MINEKLIDKFKSDGVVLLRQIVDINWINILRKGVKKNFNNPSQYKCVYNPGSKEPNIDDVMDSLNSIKK